MSGISGYSNQKKLGLAQFVSVYPVGSSKFASPSPQLYLSELTANPIAITDVALSDDQKIVYLEIVAHSARVNDCLRIVSSANLAGWETEIVEVVDANVIGVLNVFSDDSGSSVLPQVGDTAKTLRWVTATSDSSGALNVVANLGPTQILKDGVAVEVAKDTVNPSNTVAIPVEIVATSGTPINITTGDINVQTSHAGANYDSMRIGNGTNLLNVNGDGSSDVNVLSSVLPTGAASESTLSTLNGKVPSNLTVTATRLLVDGSGVTQPVSAASLPLPTGAATSANQTTANTSLSTIATNTTISKGAGAVDANTTRVTVSSDGPLMTALGGIADAAASTDTGSFSILAFIKRGLQNWTTLQAKIPSIGQQVKASSLSVAWSTEQEAQIGIVTETAPASDTASSGLNGRLQRIAQRLTSLIALLPASLGQKASASSLAVSLSTEQEALIGSLTETAPASDTASSGLNGRLQRIAQRLTSLIALFPSSLGQKTAANSFAVTIASDQSAVSVTQTALTASYQEITNLTTSAQTFTAPAGAKWCKIYAADTNSANIRVRLSGTATVSSGLQLQPGRAEDFNAVGNISVIAESGSGLAVNVHFGA